MSKNDEGKETRGENGTGALNPQTRARMCQAEVEAVLARYGFAQGAEPFITPEGRVLARIVLMEDARRDS